MIAALYNFIFAQNMKKLTLISSGSPRARGTKPGVLRGLAAFVLVLAMALMLYLFAHWALTDSDSIVRGFASLAFLACTAATIFFIAAGLRKWFGIGPLKR